MADKIISEESLQADVASALSAYQEKAQTGNAAELRTLSDKVKEAKKALSDFISSGSDACPSCGELPHGMVVRETQEGKVYEVGCIKCPPVIFDKDGNVATDKTPASEKTRVSFSARGFMPSLAVKNWNDQKYLRDKKL